MAGMRAEQVCAVIDGLVGTMAISAKAGQKVAAFCQTCKDIVRMSGNRNVTDWKFQGLSDIDQDGSAETGATDLIAATYVYALLVGSVGDDAEIDWVALYDADSATFDGTAALSNSVFGVKAIPLGTTVEDYHVAFVDHAGFALATGLTVAADGQDGTNPATDDMRGWILYR